MYLLKSDKSPPGFNTHLFLKTPTNSCIPIKANTEIKNIDNKRTSVNILIDLKKALTIVFKPKHKQYTKNSINYSCSVHNTELM